MKQEPEENIEESLTEQVLAEKLYSAESYSAIVRMAIVVINTVAYVFLMDHATCIPWLANSVVVAAFIYSVYVVSFRPFERYSLMRTSQFTFLSDALFITVWIIATGNASSPFFLLWYVSIIAVGQRFSFRETILTSALYALIYVIILRVDIGAIATADLFLRVLYIPVTGALAAFFSQGFANQVEDKLKAKKAELKAVEAQRKQQELLSELQDIRSNLERSVETRTQELKREIVARERVQRLQDRLLRNLERTNAELESFAYVTSHDLKAPLRGIATIVDWLQSDYADKLDDNGRENLKLLKLRTQRMNDLIEGILQYSRAGKQTDEIQKVKVRELVEETIKILPVPGHVDIRIEGEFPTVVVNRTTMLQVFENLIANACKFADPEKGDVRVKGEKQGKEWLIHVSDNGNGIAKEYHNKIFEMFQVLGDSNNSDGTGVGLAIVKKIVTNWGGKVWVESEPGAGADFLFTLPASMTKNRS